VFVLGKPFQSSLFFLSKARVYPSTFQVLHSRVVSWPYPQALQEAGKACHE
jgi:hypothetical protein